MASVDSGLAVAHGLAEQMKAAAAHKMVDHMKTGTVVHMRVALAHM